MRNRLLACLLMLLCSVPALGQYSIQGLAQRGLFRLTAEQDNGTHTGTGFCVPGRSAFILTAAHMIGQDMTVTGLDGTSHPIKSVVVNDDKTDVAVLLMDDRPCELNPMEFAKDSGPIGEDLQMVGFGGGGLKPIYTRGWMASDPGMFEEAPKGDRAAQLNAMGGHSGSPIFNSRNQVVGMLVGTYEAQDLIDVLVPVEVLKKVIR